VRVLNPHGFTESQRKLFFQLQNSTNEEAEASIRTRPDRVASVKSHLPRLHSAGEKQSLAAAFQEWSETCAQFETEELLDVLDNVHQAAQRAQSQGRPYHFSAQLAYSLMVFLDGALADLESEEDENIRADPEHQRLTVIFDAAEEYFLAMVSHQDALEAEAAAAE
jgi:hypothetical protein